MNTRGFFGSGKLEMKLQIAKRLFVTWVCEMAKYKVVMCSGRMQGLFGACYGVAPVATSNRPLSVNSLKDCR